MSLITVHLRWNHVAPEQYQVVMAAGSQSDQLPAGCLSRQVRHHGTVLMATEVWDSEQAGNHLDDLVAAVGEAGVDERPQVAMFSVPQMYVAAYRRAVPPVTIPSQPGPPAVERLSEATTDRVRPVSRP